MLRAWRLRSWAGPRLSLARAESILIPEPKSTELKIGGIQSRGMSQKRFREFRAENDAVKDEMIRLALAEPPVHSCRIRAPEVWRFEYNYCKKKSVLNVIINQIELFHTVTFIDIFIFV